MTTKAQATFQITAWQEDTYEDLEGSAKLTRATAAQTFSGDLQGDGSVTWLMAYSGDDDATYVGLQRINGHLEDRGGSSKASVTWPACAARVSSSPRSQESRRSRSTTTSASRLRLRSRACASISFAGTGGVPTR